MKIKVYAYTESSAMRERGADAGLSEDAQNYFRYFNEVPLELDVKDDGGVVGCRVLINFFESVKRRQG